MNKRFPLCIIPAAGRGTRMGGDVAKPLRRLPSGDLVASIVIRFWAQLAEKIVVVIAPEHREQWEQHDSADSWPLVYFTEQHGQDGVCGAVLAGLDHAGAPRTFCVGLGDCLFDGEFNFDGLSDFHGVGVMEGDTDFARSYAVQEVRMHDVGYHDPLGITVIEKPLMGLGAYFFNWTAIGALEQNRNITDAVAALPGIVKAIPFTGKYLNCTYPEDLQRWQAA